MLIDKKITIYFDGNCGFCLKSVMRIKNYFHIRLLEIKNAHVYPERKKEMLQHNSWIIVDEAGDSHYRYDGFLLLLSASKRFHILTKFLSLPPIKLIGDNIYKHTSRNRGINF